MSMVWFSTTIWGTSSEGTLLADGMVVAVVWDDGVDGVVQHYLQQQNHC